MSGKEQKDLVAFAFERALEQVRNPSVFESRSAEYLRKRSGELLEETIDILTKQIKSGRFLPYDYEVSFGYGRDEKLMEYELTGKEIMRLRGRIDRVDMFNVPEGEDKGAYVRIIDYKTGNKEFSLNSVYYGQELQLIVYLKAAEKLLDRNLANQKSDLKALSAGVYYYHVNETELDFESLKKMDEDERADEILKASRMTGATNSNPVVYKAMDENLMSAKSSKVINLTGTKDGIKKDSKAYSNVQFSAISDHVDSVIKNMGDEIFKGTADINPKKEGKKISCTYCPYVSVCKFDLKRGGMKIKELLPLKDGEIFDRIMDHDPKSGDETEVSKQ